MSQEGDSLPVNVDDPDPGGLVEAWTHQSPPGESCQKSNSLGVHGRLAGMASSMYVASCPAIVVWTGCVAVVSGILPRAVARSATVGPIIGLGWTCTHGFLNVV